MTDAEREQLHRVLRAHSTPLSVARRCRIVLLLDGGRSHRQIMVELGAARQTVDRWKKRFVAGRVSALLGLKNRGGQS